MERRHTAKAGIQRVPGVDWIPAFAGMTIRLNRQNKRSIQVTVYLRVSAVNPAPAARHLNFALPGA